MARRRRRGGLAEAFQNFQDAYEDTGRILADKEIGDRAQATQGEQSDIEELGFTGQRELSGEERYAQEMRNANTYRKYGLESRAKNAEQMARQGRAADLQYETGLMQRDAMRMEQEKQRMIEAVGAKYRGVFNDTNALVRHYETRYNNNEGRFGQGAHAGMKAQIQQTADGIYVKAINPETGVEVEGPPRFFSYDQMKGQATKDLMMEMATIDPKNALHHLATFNQREQEMAQRREEADRTYALHRDKNAADAQYHRDSLGLQQKRLDLARTEANRAIPGSTHWLPAQFGATGDRALFPVTTTYNRQTGLPTSTMGKPMTAPEGWNFDTSPGAIHSSGLRVERPPTPQRPAPATPAEKAYVKGLEGVDLETPAGAAELRRLNRLYPDAAAKYGPPVSLELDDEELPTRSRKRRP